MRLWTFHPKHLDPPGLVALWREGLLAQAVLLGKTRGYKRHPQLIRFLSLAHPAAAIAAYLRAVQREAAGRGYRFNPSKIAAEKPVKKIQATRGQLLYEWARFKKKIARRNPAWRRTRRMRCPLAAHPLFKIVPGPVQPWERVPAAKGR